MLELATGLSFTHESFQPLIDSPPRARLGKERSNPEDGCSRGETTMRSDLEMACFGDSKSDPRASVGDVGVGASDDVNPGAGTEGSSSSGTVGRIVAISSKVVGKLSLKPDDRGDRGAEIGKGSGLSSSVA